MIVFSSVSKSFADKQTAIFNLDLEISEGDFLVVTGPSGAGKTTLMKLLIREYLPTSGKITFENHDLQQYKASEIPALRRKIGVVFQDYKLIEDMNVWENVALPLYISNKKEEEIESRVTDLLNLVGLADKALQFPKQLSGGEAQRVSIARALSTAPKVIFADEPTGNLDSEASLKITRLLRKINELGTTLLFATHDQLVLNELAQERIIYLEKRAPSTPNENENKDKQENKEETLDKTAKKDKADPERVKVKERQTKLAQEMADAQNKKPKQSTIKTLPKLHLPKLKLKLHSKHKKDKKQHENS